MNQQWIAQQHSQADFFLATKAKVFCRKKRVPVAETKKIEITA